MTAHVHGSTPQSRHIAAVLSRQREEIGRVLRRTYDPSGLDETSAARSADLVEAFNVALVAGDVDLFVRGVELGRETSAWLRKRGDTHRDIPARLAIARIDDAFLIDLPEQIDDPVRATAQRAAATFIGGHLAGIVSGDTARSLDLAALTVRRLGTARSVDELARVLTASTLELMHADSTWYAGRRDAKWAIVEARGLTIAPDSRRIGDATIDGIEALLSGEPIAYDDFTAASPSLQALAADHGIVSALLVPLMIEGVCEAMLGLGRSALRPFRYRDLALAGIVAAQFGARVRELRAQSRSREALDALRASERVVREQLRRKERVVDILQRTYIPHALPTVAGLRFDALYLPAGDESRVGGDWYDVFQIEDGRMLFSVGDVSGNGIDAAVTMGLIRQTIFTAALASSNPSDVLVTVNRALIAQNLSPATAIAGIYDPADRSVTYACAGHPPPIVFDAGGARMLAYGGLPLGIEPVNGYDVRSFQLTEHALLVLYTDALIEYDRDVVRGVERLVDVIGRIDITGDDSENLAARLADEVFAGASADDDLAILTMRSFPKNESQGISSIQTHREKIAWDFHTVDARSIAIVRSRFTRFLTPLVTPGENLFESEIVLGELLANAVEHAPGRVHVELDWERSTPVLTVRDYGRGGVRRAELPADDLDEHGRGMFLVEALARTVGIERCSDGGTKVTASLALTRLEGPADA